MSKDKSIRLVQREKKFANRLTTTKSYVMGSHKLFLQEISAKWLLSPKLSITLLLFLLNKHIKQYDTTF